MVAQGIIDKQAEEADAPEIKRYWVNADFGYRMYMIVNGDPASSYQETMNYTAFDGLTLLAPEKGSTYEVTVEAGQTRVILIKQSCGGFSMASSYSSMVLKSEGALIEECLADGQQNDRAEGIYQKYMQHSGGIIYVYKNETEDKTLSEELGFNLEGLKIDG